MEKQRERDPEEAAEQFREPPAMTPQPAPHENLETPDDEKAGLEKSGGKGG